MKVMMTHITQLLENHRFLCINRGLKPSVKGSYRFRMTQKLMLLANSTEMALGKNWLK